MGIQSLDIGTGNPNGRFQTTHWSVVLQARDATQTTARQALAALCEAYWYPLYIFLRRRGSSADEAADLIQGYFTRFLEKDYIHDVQPTKGRFRSFLLASLKHFISNERARAQALRRGGGVAEISLDTVAAEQRYAMEPADELTPEMVYERHWALTVVERTLAGLRKRAQSAGWLEQFELLVPLLTGDGPQRPYREIAEQLDLSEGAVKVAIHRLRRSYGKQLRKEIADTVASRADVDDEVRHLLTVLGAARGGT